MIAAGIPAIFSDNPILLCLAGYVVMRVAMAAFWFAAAAGDPQRRKTALSYGVGILVMQCFWIAAVLLVDPQSNLYPLLIAVAIIGELAVPALAEYRFGDTLWHRHHIIERYGLLNIIVLGECFLAIVAMLARDDYGSPAVGHSIFFAVAAAVITFSMWGLYFTDEDHLQDAAMRRAFFWGYSHFVIFATGAATGAGFAVVHEVMTGHAKISAFSASMSVAIPAALYMFMIWLVRDRFTPAHWRKIAIPVGALAVALVPLAIHEALPAIAAIMLVTAVIRRGFKELG